MNQTCFIALTTFIQLLIFEGTTCAQSVERKILSIYLVGEKSVGNTVSSWCSLGPLFLNLTVIWKFVIFYFICHYARPLLKFWNFIYNLTCSLCSIGPICFILGGFNPEGRCKDETSWQTLNSWCLLGMNLNIQTFLYRWMGFCYMDPEMNIKPRCRNTESV